MALQIKSYSHKVLPNALVDGIPVLDGLKKSFSITRNFACLPL